MAVNPTLGKRAGNPETGILPRSRNGAASVTTTPTNPGQTERLARYLATKTRQQYEARIRAEAAQLGLKVSGQITDPAVLFRLNQRAAWAAQRITQTAQKQMAQARANGQSLADLKDTRDGYKPEQIFTTELNTANNWAAQDFAANNPGLTAQRTYHVEPTDAEEDICQAEIDKGSQPIDSFISFPAHVGCPHEVVADPVSLDDTTAISAGTNLDGGDGTASIAPEDISFGDVTAAQLTAAGFWLAGLAITAAYREWQQHQQQQDDQSEESFTENAADGKTLALDLDDTALKFPDVLVPIARHYAKHGRVVVLTGNETEKARQLWDEYGYPEPNAWAVHNPADDAHIGKWKAEQCKSLSVDLFIDDMHQGSFAGVFMKHKPKSTVALQVLIPKGEKPQNVGHEELSPN